MLLAFVLVSVAVASFLKVGATDLIGAALLGLLCGLIVTRSRKHSDWLDIDNVYTYDPVADAAIDAYEATSMPYILMESAYENEHDVSTRQLRTQAYHALLSGATGHIFGNNPIWHFDGGGLFEAPVTWNVSSGARSASGAGAPSRRAA